MKNYLLIFYSLILLQSTLYAQTKYDTYDALIIEADSLKLYGNCVKAIEKYQLALSIINPESASPYFNIADCAIYMEDFNLADKWIREGISKGGATQEYILSFEWFNDIKKEEFYKKIIQDYKHLRQKYYCSIDDLDLYFEIEKLKQRDQFVRQLDDYLNDRTDEEVQQAIQAYFDFERKKDSAEIKKYRAILFPEIDEDVKKIQIKLIEKVDSLNMDRLITITKKHGWQKQAWILLWHQRGSYNQDNYVWDYFRSLINREIDEGKISRTFWEPFDEFSKAIQEDSVKQ